MQSTYDRWRPHTVNGIFRLNRREQNSECLVVFISLAEWGKERKIGAIQFYFEDRMLHLNQFKASSSRILTNLLDGIDLLLIAHWLSAFNCNEILGYVQCLWTLAKTEKNSLKIDENFIYHNEKSSIKIHTESNTKKNFCFH